MANCDLKKKRNLRFPRSPLLSTQRKTPSNIASPNSTRDLRFSSQTKFWNVSFTTRYGESVHTVYEYLLRLIIIQRACVISRRRSRRNRGGRGKGGEERTSTSRQRELFVIICPLSSNCQSAVQCMHACCIRLALAETDCLTDCRQNRCPKPFRDQITPNHP